MKGAHQLGRAIINKCARARIFEKHRPMAAARSAAGRQETGLAAVMRECAAGRLLR